MAEKKIKWTPRQLQAITERGGDILVTASAGTGKTAVLSGRCVNIVSDKSLCPDVLSMLVLTFTDAAAEQMRSRIAGQLRDALLENQNAHLRSQLILLAGADIGTIHSFCKRLITEHFYKLALDPTFRIIDGDEQELLKADVLEKTIEWAWGQSHLQQGLEQLLWGRGVAVNDGFLSSIIEASNFLDTVVFRQEWYRRATMFAEAANPFTTELGEQQKQIVADKLAQVLGRLQHAWKLYENEISGGDWLTRYQHDFIKPIAECAEALGADDWDRCARKITNYVRPRMTEIKDVSQPIAELIKKLTKQAIDDFRRLRELAVLNPDYLDKLSGAVSLQTKILIKLVDKFEQLYRQAKQNINSLDFADLEHYALKLLIDDGSQQEELIPSETALMLRKKYKYIFVDEYQDINPVQQALLDMLSGGGNIFVVGDVKQSIYSFRGTDPTIFVKHLAKSSSTLKKSSDSLRIDLNVNFRSNKGVLDFVNKVFGRIMTADFANIDYDDSAALRPAEKDKPADKKSPVVELHIVDEEIDSEKSKKLYSKRRRQVAMIARRIRQMVGADTSAGEFKIFDKQIETERPVEYRDIVILMRSPYKRANDYAEVLRLAGVPVSCQASGGYFEATEISDMVCLLKILDNPQRDIELAAVFRSPLFGFTDTELAKIKLYSQTDQRAKNFYRCVAEYSADGSDVELAAKLTKTLDQVEEWRTLGRRGSLADLIWHIYRKTGFLSFVSALPNGRGRRANLLKLHDRAIQFAGFAGSGGAASLTRFIQFIEKLQETGQDWSVAEPEATAENAIRIMSIHKSKGLEFPVVFLAELDSPFNKTDAQGHCLFDAESALGLQIVDRESNARLNSLGHQVIAEKKLATTLAEEMRILYVAMTRARDRLVLTACQKRKDCREIIVEGLFFGAAPVADWRLRSCRRPIEWVLYALSDQQSLHRAFETGLAAENVKDELFSLNFYGPSELEQLCEYVERLRKNKGDAAKASRRLIKKTGLLEKVRKSLNWRYGFEQATTMRAKDSVTQLTHPGDEFAKVDYSAVLQRTPKALLSAESGDEPEPRLVGAATHLVISALDLTKPVTKKAIEETKEKLLADGAIAEVVAGQVDTDSIAGFFESELGNIALDGDSRVFQEWPFSFAAPAGRLKDETVIVQGVIDMLVDRPGGLLVIDFKTDSVSGAEVTERAERYRGQVELYATAAGAITKAKTVSKWLYFLAPGKPVEIKPKTQ